MAKRQPQDRAPATDATRRDGEWQGEDWPTGRYRLQQPHYMRATPQAEHQAVLRAGAEVEFAGRPSQAMTPLDDGARQAVMRRDAELAAAQDRAFAADALLQGLSGRQLRELQERLAARLGGATSGEAGT